jgi:hypothetical protein
VIWLETDDDDPSAAEAEIRLTRTDEVAVVALWRAVADVPGVASGELTVTVIAAGALTVAVAVVPMTRELET